MGGSLQIVFLAPRLPWPLDTGGKIRTYHLLRVLARRHELRLLALSDLRGGNTDEERGCDALRRLGAEVELFRSPPLWQRALGGRLRAVALPLTVARYQHAAVAARLQMLARRGQLDVLHCDHLHLAVYATEVKRPFVIDEHNVETVIWDRFARDRAEPLVKRLLFRHQASLFRRLEARLCRQASLVLLCSRTDEDVLLQMLRGGGVEGGALARTPASTMVVPNGVDLEYFAAPVEARGHGHVVFTGSMDWPPNENAVLTFLDEIWPLMREEIPSRRLLVVGRNPSARLVGRARAAGVEVTGTVPDIRPFLRGALALVVPMRVGGGTRLKILEAFAAGVPVISTRVGAEGIDAAGGVHYLPAETATDFAARARELQQEPGLRSALVSAARALARDRYSWEAIGEHLAMEYTTRFGSAGDAARRSPSPPGSDRDVMSCLRSAPVGRP